MIEQAIREILAGDTVISEMVNNVIRPMLANQDDMPPFIVYEVTNDADASPTYTGPSSYSEATIDIDVVAMTYLECSQICKEIRRVFDGKAVNSSNVRIAPSRLSDESDIRQELIEGMETPAYVRTMTFLMLYRAL